MTHTNRLAQESSPYLLQHAHNPVDWFPWGDEAFEKAKGDDKPILVSIGYAACHWCHVMERESFEDEETAAFMNAHFVNIKVDREERPDVDHIYMDAVQAISGSGGWPLNVFLTPDGKPFYGGTYFPPRRAFNRASWREVLEAIANTYRDGREKILTDAETLTQHLQQSNNIGFTKTDEPLELEAAFKAVMKQADKEWGGFGAAPKFPQTFTILFLVRYSLLTGNEEARQQALLSLDKMANGGLYDQVGGGFARYSTDREWLVPHFEKMLYDNALLLQAYAEAYQLTGNERYKLIIEETVQFVQRELLHPDGGFYSALDADSEGVEGKFYVWDFEKVQELLGSDAELFCAFYNIVPGGNWEGHSIPHIQTDLQTFAQEQGLAIDEVADKLKKGCETLLAARADRVRPGLDDKVLLGWNALMNTALSKAYAATGHEDLKKLAERNMHFLLHAFRQHEKTLYHTWKGGIAKYPAFLDDYANLISSLIELAQVTGEVGWLHQATAFTQTVLQHFSDAETPLFYFTHAAQTDVIIRKKEVYDGATPSGNAVMAANLFQLSILLDKPEWRDRAEAMLTALGPVVIKYPTSFGVWLGLVLQMAYGAAEIAIVGENWSSYLKNVLHLYLPHKIVMAAATASDAFPLLRGKEHEGQTLLYLCQDYACRQPVASLDEFTRLILSNYPEINTN